MKNTPRAYLVAILYFFLAVFSCGCAKTDTKKVCFKTACIQAELADTQSKRIQGLMFRESLAHNRGMLFVFDKEAQHSLWMKNMRFPLDIIWFDRNKKIVDIYQNALPCKEICKDLIPQSAVAFVLEVNAGFVAKNQIQVGDKVDF